MILFWRVRNKFGNFEQKPLANVGSRRHQNDAFGGELPMTSH